ncbi:ubiquitin-like domain-containing protein [Isoptericola sp. 178]|uniref:aggregation-promoting factor C-terminal-like domain-containing protein n=1 Tax=Isoptericola sp. 178 TaxID=3064651 RepID=UPI002712FE63|nr:ubiquitin-like domain-containing protein [Isoptericola sp. 178]MDO8144014.1 ubiquitin-like domain-containing protein [Isoptericola sp. 178]
MTSVPENIEPQPTTAETRAVTRTHRVRRRRTLIASFTVGALALGVGSAVGVSQAHKTVTLDVDGETRSVGTFAGDVDGLLDEQGVDLGERDVVAPSTAAALRDGSDIVVRTGKQVDVEVDGKESSTWINAADANEALNLLSQRGSEVRLVASRSADRAALPLDVHAGEDVAVVADDEIEVVDGSDELDAVLGAADVEIDSDDIVTVTDAATAGVNAKKLPEGVEMPDVAAVVERLEVERVEKTKKIERDVKVVQDDGRYEDLDRKVKKKGRDGVRTIVREVTTIDGEKVSSEKISSEVTKKPKTRVLVQGTKERPEPEPEPAPEPATSSSSSSSSSGSSSSGSSSSGSSYSGSNRSIGQQMAAERGWTGSQWTCLESLWTKESNWSHTASNPSSGAYGIPQALPGGKMSSHGGDWQTNPATQIAWGLDYIAGRYGTPCGAWSHSQANNWY